MGRAFGDSPLPPSFILSLTHLPHPPLNTQAEEEQHLQQALRQYANKHGATVVRQHALELSQQQHLQRQRSQQQQDTQLRTHRPQGAPQVQVQQAQPRPAAPQAPKRAQAASAAAAKPK
jgi:hypothetical protein